MTQIRGPFQWHFNEEILREYAPEMLETLEGFVRALCSTDRDVCEAFYDANPKLCDHAVETLRRMLGVELSPPEQTRFATQTGWGE